MVRNSQKVMARKIDSFNWYLFQVKGKYSVDIYGFFIAETGAFSAGGNNVNPARRRAGTVPAIWAFYCDSRAVGKLITARHAVAGAATALIPCTGGAVGTVLDCRQLHILRRNHSALLIIAITNHDMRRADFSKQVAP